MNTTDVPSLVNEMRILNTKVKLNELAGSILSETEVGPQSFVQMIEVVPVIKGMAEPVTWRFHQFWVNNAHKETQKGLIGAYLNEKVGNFKIIGIFSAVNYETK